jgi:hypothetical protein
MEKLLNRQAQLLSGVGIRLYNLSCAQSQQVSLFALFTIFLRFKL